MLLRKRIISSLLVLSIIVSTSPVVYADEDPGGGISPGPDIQTASTGSEEGGHSPPIFGSGDPPMITEGIIQVETSGDPEEAPGIIEDIKDLLAQKDQAGDYIEDGLLSDIRDDVIEEINEIIKEEEPEGITEAGIIIEPKVVIEPAIEAVPAATASEAAIVPDPVYVALFQGDERKYSSEATFTLVNDSGQDRIYRIKDIEATGLSPYVVPYNKYTEREWSNLGVTDTLNNLAIGLEVDGEQTWYDGTEADLLYMEAGSVADIRILFQHGHSWPAAHELKYLITFETEGESGSSSEILEIKKTEERQMPSEEITPDLENQTPNQPFNDTPAAEAGQVLPEEGAINDDPLPDQSYIETSAQTDLHTGGNPSLDPDQVSPDSGPGGAGDTLEEI